MATSMRLKTTGKWKPVKIDYNLLHKNDFNSLISLEELTDYQLLGDSTSSNDDFSSKKRKIKEIHKTRNKEILIRNESKNFKENDDQKKGKAKKKRKKKKKDSVLQQDSKDKSEEERLSPKSGLNTNNKTTGKKTKKLGKFVQTESDFVNINTEIELKDCNEKNGKDTKKKGKKRKNKEKVTVLPSKKLKLDLPEIVPVDEPVTKNVRKEMESWKDLYVPEEILLALRGNNFTSPTHIQSLVLPHAIRDRLDIVGAAETGSGKTLAFGIPVIHKTLKYKETKLNKGIKGNKNNYKEREWIEQITKETIQENSDDNDLDSFHGDDEDDLVWESDENSHTDSDDVDEMSNSEDVIENSEGDDSDNDLGDDISDVRDDISDVRDDINDEEQKLGCVAVVDDADFSSLGVEETKSEIVHHPLALILEPTRELAVQVKNHLQAVLKYTDIKVAIIVGGMSLQKQQRVLKKKPEILVATPGRLWELFQMNDPYLLNIDQIQCLVVDEADRMVEKGHFEELEKLFLHINKDDTKRQKRQNFVFSATLTMIHTGPYRPTKKKRIKLTEAGKLESLIEKIGLRNKPKIIDLSRKKGTVETLTEARINCTKEEKDLYLYYFLHQFKGRTLVFANSKDCIRRLMSIFSLLQTSPMSLHADMHQKQRLKNLERFTANPNGLLLASDVAARGLDIPNVQHVIHYQVPLTVENYVHRSGRTARASKEGISVMFIGPDDVKNYRKIIHTLNRNEDLPIIPVDYQLLPSLKQRLSLAVKIDVTEHRFEKKKRQNDWFLKAAKEMDMEIDDTHLLNDLGSSTDQLQHKNHVKQLKHELNALLHQSLMSKSFSGKYPTKYGKLLIPQQPKVGGDAISCVRKDKNSQKKLMEQIQLERTVIQKSMEKRQNQKKLKRQEKRKKKKKNKET